MKGKCAFCGKEKDIIPYMCSLGICKECIEELENGKVLFKSKKVKQGC